MIITRQRRMPAVAWLCLLLQHNIRAGDSFSTPQLLRPQHLPITTIESSDPQPWPLHYSSNANDFDSSRLSNATSTIDIPKNGKEDKSDQLDAEMISTTSEPVPLANAVGNVSWTRNVYDYAKAAAGSLGDIMAQGPAIPFRAGNLSEAIARRDGLVTSAIPSGTLASRFGIEHPLDRMALTANGNLQRLVSSYYDAPVEVIVDHCCLMKDPDSPQAFPIILPNGRPKAKRWDRLVRLKVHNQTFCRAHSIITVFDPVCQELVESGAVGLGQLFRYLDILPEFELHNAGPYPAASGGGFWREYSLRCAELSCDIHEDFRSGIWDVHPLGQSN